MLIFERSLTKFKRDSQATRHDLLALYWERLLITDAAVSGAKSTPAFTARKCSFLRMY